MSRRDDPAGPRHGLPFRVIAGGFVRLSVFILAGGAALTSTTSCTPATAASSPPALSATFLPCAATDSGLPCVAPPTQLQVDLPPSGQPDDVVAIDVTWIPGTDRPPSAPQPAKASVVLPRSATVNCVGAAAAPAGDTPVCWNWPADLTSTYGDQIWVLNGTYQVDPCSGSSSSQPCVPSADFSGRSLTLASPPSAPARLTATSSSGTVTLRWALGNEPDLVGYVVARDSEDVFVCSIDGLGPGGGVPCGSTPSFSDQPGTGTWNYQLEALRFGIDSQPAHLVPSAASTVAANVSAAAVSHPAQGLALPPLPVPRSMPPLPPGGAVLPIQPVSASAETGAAVEPAALNPRLPYSDDPVLANPSAVGTALRVPVPARKSVDSAAEIALAVMALALAVHAWYVRGLLREAAFRVAERSDR